jgi:diguanylate cyclase (GGDEF)-like protein
VANEVDAQTGAYTRTHFERLVEEAARAAKKSAAPLSLLWVDVDELTEANDAHGRERVDEALGQLAQRISRVLDGKGPIGRVLGGAFAALLPGLGIEPALKLAEAVRAAQREASDAVPLRVSCGVAALLPHEPFGNLLDAAERACIRAKQAGRDAVAR